MILQRIVWPRDKDSDGEEDDGIEETCLITGFLRTFIVNGEETKQRNSLNVCSLFHQFTQGATYVST